MRPYFRLAVQDPKPMYMLKDPTSMERDIVSSMNYKQIIVEETGYTNKLEHHLLKLRFEFEQKHFRKEANLIVNVKDFLHIVIIHNRRIDPSEYRAFPNVDIPTKFMKYNIVIVPKGDPQIVPTKWEDMLWDNVQTDEDDILKD